jgi:agmatinase
MYTVSLISFFLSAVIAREIVFPRIAAIQGSGQVPLGNDNIVDIVTDSQFSGLTTFAHLPYINCFVDDGTDLTPYDIAILGAPFDTVCFCIPSTHYRGPVIMGRRCYRVSLLAPEPGMDLGAFGSARVDWKDGVSILE